jgi:catechol 2,3-dioxygenase-like lactoylglutathione lyase family enzyme
MSTAQPSRETFNATPNVRHADTKLEVVVLPVSDVERSKRFYERMGWRLDADFSSGSEWHVLQMTPPGSPCSIMFGKGLTNAAPGSVQGTFLVVDDIEKARAELVGHGVEVSDVFHFKGGLNVLGNNGHLPGPDPEGRSYRSWATFRDPDGNSWYLQEVKARLPGRGVSSFDVPTLIEFLREAEKRHGEYEATAPEHHWTEWYAAYVVARQQGKNPEESAKDGARHVGRARR